VCHTGIFAKFRATDPRRANMRIFVQQIPDAPICVFLCNKRNTGIFAKFRATDPRRANMRIFVQQTQYGHFCKISCNRSQTRQYAYFCATNAIRAYFYVKNRPHISRQEGGKMEGAMNE
jgi:hypothetical protein